MQMIEVIANGEACSVPDKQPLPDFIAARDLHIDRVVVEYNGQALNRSEARQICLQNGDRLEIVRIVAGG